MAYRLSHMSFLRPFTRSGHDPEAIPSTSRPTSFLPSSPLSTSARTPRTSMKSRPPPLMLRPSSDENHVTVLQSLGRAPTLVLRLSSTALPSGDVMAAMSEHLQSGPVSAVLPPPRPDTAPLTEPLPRIRIRPATDDASGDKGRRSYDVPMLHRKLRRKRITSSTASTADSETRHIWGTSRSMPSSPQVPHPFIPPFAATLPPSVPQRVPAPEGRATRTLRSSTTRSGLDDNPRDYSTASGLSTEWISSEDSPSETNINIKIVDSAQPQVTPSPTHDLAVRPSIVLERLGDIVGPSSPPTPEQGSGLVRKDSGVLCNDDLVRMRRARSVY